jgi:hypothetical protein
VHLEEHGGDQPQQGVVVGEALDEVGPVFDLLCRSTGWMRHITVAMLTHALLAANAAPKGAAERGP